MPITFKNSDKKSEQFTDIQGPGSFSLRFDNFLKHEKESNYQKILRLPDTSNVALYPDFDNGFIGAVFRAYCRHHNLSIKPDDIWVAILTQFSLYLNANAEKLRGKFVSHDGKKELTVYQDAPELESANFPLFVQNMVDEMQKHIVDTETKEWMLPNFTTTTHEDITVASLVLMSSVHEYFSYRFCLACGIPNITLEGEVKDWENIYIRIQKFKKYQDEILTKWCEMLLPILEKFIESAKGNVDNDFWSKICSELSFGSGPTFLSGWISVFNVFDNKGNWRGDNKNYHETTSPWPIIDTCCVTSGVVSVPFTIDSYGTEYDAKAFAGHFTYSVLNGGTLLKPSLNWVIALTGKKI